MEVDGVTGGLGSAEPELRGGQREAQQVTQVDPAWLGPVPTGSCLQGWVVVLAGGARELHPGWGDYGGYNENYSPEKFRNDFRRKIRQPLQTVWTWELGDIWLPASDIDLHPPLKGLLLPSGFIAFQSTDTGHVGVPREISLAQIAHIIR